MLSTCTAIEVDRSIPNDHFLEMLSSVTERGTQFRFKAGGMSMSPFVRSGDVLTISPVNSPLKVGEVVAFRHSNGGRFAVHRIIDTGKQGLLLKGDNCSLADGWISPEAIIGRVTRIERGGRVILFGLGGEQSLIAVLSRTNLLIPLVAPVRVGYRLWVRRGAL